MARRRKTEVKASEKSSHKYVPVRKSSRQIAKKQLEEKKINGNILETSCSNSLENSKSTNEDHSKILSKKNQNSQKKHSKHKGTSSNNVVVNKEDIVFNASQYKRDAGESDSQDYIDNIINESEKLSPEDVRQVVVGNPSDESLPTSASVPTEVEMWSEDVIEETIICEEMEMEEDVADNSYTLAEDNVMVEQVLLVNEPNLEDKNFVEFTVIQNEDESMVITSNTENVSNNEYIIRENFNSVHSNELENSISIAHTNESTLSGENCNIADSNIDRPYINKKKIVLENRGKKQKNDKTIYDKIRKEISESISDKVRMCSIKENSDVSSEEIDCKQEGKQSKVTIIHTDLSKEDTFSKIDNELANMQINECSKELQKLMNDLSNVERVDSPVQTSLNVEKLSPINVDDESSSSILDKMEQLHRPNNSVNSHITEIFSKTIEPNNIIKNQEQNILKSNSCDDKLQYTDRVLLKSKTIQDKKNMTQQKNPEHLTTMDEYQDSEGDNSKVDCEDIKLCSSSENSNDTLLSLTNCKGREIDVKNAIGNTSDIDKKIEFRGRSGSTDTTGSESGSNSSGVRRSSRIRSIGLMKQRSRGRGLVTKPNIDISKATLQQEKDKVVNNINPSITQEIKIDNSETQCDKENNSSKISISLDISAPLSSSYNTTGYDSDSSKPVKVKSRWRRSSELEMGGSCAGFGSIIAPTSMFGPSVALPSEVGCSAPVNTGESNISSELKHNIINKSVKPCAETEQVKNASITSNNVSTVLTVPQIPKTIGAKISLPMVTETEDREMEERLSQFEHLRENLYLTERYTNKETKRMVCDCFLTEEDIERGELGCGEDCLNRLLMIECGARCVVGDRCTNKRFQNCEYAKCEVFRTEKKGFGLRAVVDIMAGEFIMEYVGEVVDPKDFKRRAKDYSKDKNRHYYFMALKSDQIIDATMKGNVSRFINHSCDPNAETQKWTVNGELRIGFFNKKFIAAGEEITFDYHFQRYGKEAQKCYCEASNCRGWIGDTPEEEKEKIEKIEEIEEKRERDTKKKKEEKKPVDYMEDEDLEEEMDKLCSGGLKNRAHTLTLSRLMVRSRELKHRTRLLRLIQSGEQPCRRLFLDYHGLRLIWSYVMDIAADESEEAQQFRLEVLKTLNTLPIPNKTMLMDSKIYDVVERWAKRLYLSPNADSPEDDQVKKTICEELNSNSDSNEKKNLDERLNDIPDKRNNNIENCLAVGEIKSENTDLIPDLACNLLAEWSNLKEVFKIPKKERIEQMKEHEREADRGYREELEKEEKRSTSYDRHRSDRYNRSEIDKRGDRRRGRESPEAEHSRTKDKRIEERSLVPIPQMTKYERRQLFALKVAKEEEERQRRQQQESWQEHENRCLALGIDPHTTAMVDPQTGYPVFYNPTLGQWQHYPTQDGGEATQQCTPVYVGNPQSTSIIGQSSHVLSSAMTTDISSGITTGIPPVAYSLSQTPVFSQTTSSYSLISHPQPYSEGQLSLPNSLVSVHSGTPPISIQTPLYNHEKPADEQFSNHTSAESISTNRPVQPEISPIDLPPKWKSATDSRGRTYYYHVKERISQWLPPPPDHIGVQPDSSSTSESSDESSSSNEDDEDIDDEHNEDQKNDNMETSSITESLLSRPNVSKKLGGQLIGSSLPLPESKKRRDGLVQERIISPRREEDRVDHKAYKEIKEKLRRQKERAKLKDVEKLKKHRRSNKSKSHSRHGLSKLQSTSAEMHPMKSERRIKEAFRTSMANVMVHFLNPYRKTECKQGRITNTEDFKHLARKLTHFVLAKELKHCKSVDELQCNENVIHKAKDFVRKYMSKFGAVYQKGTDED